VSLRHGAEQVTIYDWYYWMT